MTFEIFEHTADVGIRVHAADEASLFHDAAEALFSLLVVNLGDVRPVVERPLTIEGAERDLLLFDWLNELLYVFETEQLVFAQFQVTLHADRLSAIARGEALDRARHELHHEVKAITYHGLKVEQTNNGWIAEVIVDI